ncbi:MAG: hypothetical protein Q8K50_00895 [Hydrogenophaga sp.]|jgi:hypothetical protein|uniref:hypothetical protein n=1 Tax=Hydrogenophaga sp. TaxID=1904254 RepID=UPI002715AEC9|nr:hypothetical protein [Hydrogenophaga sp.]MDO9202191.1 hypothetical protein [Hydrogenophaga sp.]MDO9482826.1 hypothetical protein [Hydrogenophaga sp.]MDO9568566.1 hypothetical protein [Hydrogenophaga sp.]MDP2092438.1 hypothetical protein [Hydrogenophaga sp.]MDP3347057.1 hypothetical protein [Hydrogenophaga sp.]
MDTYLIMLALGVGAYVMKNIEQRQRIGLLSGYLHKYQLEKLMEQLTEGYLRALGESDPQRSEPIWRMLVSTEQSVSDQLDRLAADMARMGDEQARVLRWPLAVPLASRWLPAATFDLRRLMAIHAQGFASAVQNTAGLGRKEQAFMLSAELYLFQHSCHWYCRSKAVASARLLARHKTAHAQVLAAVSPQTRAAYTALVGAL